jgi:hypothetical protein
MFNFLSFLISLLHSIPFKHGFYNLDEKCLQRGTDWAFKWSSLRFVFEGLKGKMRIRLSATAGLRRGNCLHRASPWGYWKANDQEICILEHLTKFNGLHHTASVKVLQLTNMYKETWRPVLHYYSSTLLKNRKTTIAGQNWATACRILKTGWHRNGVATCLNTESCIIITTLTTLSADMGL